MDAFHHQTRRGPARDLTAKNSGGWSRTNTHPASTGCSTLELHRINIQRRRQESNLLGTGLQPVAWPSSPGVGRASGESRTHTSRITGAVRCQLRHAGNQFSARNRTWSSTFVESYASGTPRRWKARSQESGIRGQRSSHRLAAPTTHYSPLTTHSSTSTPAGSRTQTSTFGESRDVRFTTRAFSRGQESGTRTQEWDSPLRPLTPDP